MPSSYLAVEGEPPMPVLWIVVVVQLEVALVRVGDLDHQREG
jgi:hypothetical protein